MIASPLRPRHRQEQGIAAASRLAHRGTPYGASLSFATTTHLWPLSDPPSRKPTSRPVATSRQRAARSIPGRALASSMLDSPCQGSRTGLTPPISTSVPSTPAPAALRATSATRPPRSHPNRYPPTNRGNHQITGRAAISPAYPTREPRDYVDLPSRHRQLRDHRHRPLTPGASDLSYSRPFRQIAEPGDQRASADGPQPRFPRGAGRVAFCPAESAKRVRSRTTVRG